jgi:biotin carboxyl carrier protein
MKEHECESCGTKCVNFGVGYSIYKTMSTKKFDMRKPYSKPNRNLMTAFIPGTILDVKVTEGAKVKAGTIMLILDAMKMKNQILAPAAGIVKRLLVEKGQVVKKNELLIEFAPEE